MKKIYIVIAVGLFVCTLGGLSALFALGLPFIDAFNMAEVLVVAPLHIVVTILFIMALKNFKAKLKLAYVFICASTILLAIGMLQYAVLGSINALSSVWVTSSMVEVPFALTIISIFIGMTLFARLMGVKNIVAYAWAVPVVAVVLGCLAFFIPSPRADIASDILYRNLAIYVFESVMIIGATIMAYKARAKAGALYVPALAWMFIGLVVYAPAVVLSVPVQMWLPNTHWYLVYGGSVVFFLFGGLSYVKSALELNRITYADVAIDTVELSFFGKPLKRSTAKTSDAIEAVTYLAGFVSNPSAVDPILDGLRSVTATLDSPDQKLTIEQQKDLAGVYRKLEQFLVDEEQVAKYTPDDLRRRVDKKFNGIKNDTIFWESVA